MEHAHNDSEKSSSVDEATISRLVAGRRRECVSFGMVQVKEHAMVLGDNPSTTCGPSVELDWDSYSNMTYDTVDEYESLRDLRRSEKPLVLSSRARVKLLLENGFTFREIREETVKRKKQANAFSRKKVANALRRFTNWKKETVADRVKQREQRMQAILDSLE